MSSEAVSAFGVNLGKSWASQANPGQGIPCPEVLRVRWLPAHRLPSPDAHTPLLSSNRRARDVLIERPLERGVSEADQRHCD